VVVERIERINGMDLIGAPRLIRIIGREEGGGVARHAVLRVDA
jgi:hypothetical protein